jgi:hypothetical protein
LPVILQAQTELAGSAKGGKLFGIKTVSLRTRNQTNKERKNDTESLLATAGCSTDRVRVRRSAKSDGLA